LSPDERDGVVAADSAATLADHRAISPGIQLFVGHDRRQLLQRLPISAEQKLIPRAELKELPATAGQCWNALRVGHDSLRREVAQQSSQPLWRHAEILRCPVEGSWARTSQGCSHRRR